MASHDSRGRDTIAGDLPTPKAGLKQQYEFFLMFMAKKSNMLQKYTPYIKFLSC